VLFVDAVHPTHATRPVGCWAPAKEKLAIEQTSGRQRLNIHGAIDLETGKTATNDVETVDAASTIGLLDAIEAMYPLLAMIHVFLDMFSWTCFLGQRTLSSRQTRAGLAGAVGAPRHAAFCLSLLRHLNPIERLWGVMHKHPTHNKTYATYREFADATLEFLREKVPKNWSQLCDSVTDNFRVINPKDFRVLA
jgi:hypothetical protein